MSSRVLVHRVEVVPITMPNTVVPAGRAEDSADLGGPGEDARLLAESEGGVDLVSATRNTTGDGRADPCQWVGT